MTIILEIFWHYASDSVLLASGSNSFGKSIYSLSCVPVHNPCERLWGVRRQSHGPAVVRYRRKQISRSGGRNRHQPPTISRGEICKQGRPSLSGRKRHLGFLLHGNTDVFFPPVYPSLTQLENTCRDHLTT